MSYTANETVISGSQVTTDNRGPIILGRDTNNSANYIRLLPDGTQTVAGGIVVSSLNSTTSSLSASEVFSGSAEDIREYVGVTINMFGNPDNATGTLTFQFSPNGTNWDVAVPLIVNSLNVFIPFQLATVLPYFRVLYQNNTVAQTEFRLTTVYTRTTPFHLIRTPLQTIQANEPVAVMRALVEPGLRGNLSAFGADRSIGGEAISLPYIIHAKAEFDVPFTNNDILVSQISGATATQSSLSGAVLLSTSSAGYSEVNIFSRHRVRYKPGREFRAEFSAIFPSQSLSSSNVLVGLTDITSSRTGVTGSLSGSNPNQLVVGWISNSFGFHVINSGSITTVSKSQWNIDTCNGGFSSYFTSNNLPVSLDITKANAYRIRGVWFGVGPVYLEIKSPDDRWVPVHMLRYPNTSTIPYIRNPNMFPYAGIIKKPGAPAGTLQLSCFCWAGGTIESDLGFEPHEINSRTHVQRAEGGLSVSTTAYSVTVGRQLFLKSVNITVINTSLITSGRLDIIDATSGTTGTILHSLTLAAATNQAGSTIVQPITMPVPMIALQGVRFVVVAGTLTFAYSIQGYEKDLSTT